MKIAWLTIVCAAGTMISAPSWAQVESQSGQSPQTRDSSAVSEMEKDIDKSATGRSLSATGRQTQSLRASKLIGAQIKDPSGSQIGQIEDFIVSPGGRIDFAVVSLSGAGTASSASATSAGSTAGKLTPVPWSLLKTSPSGSTSGTYSQSAEQPTFTLNVEQTRLQQAPTFSWSDLNEATWRQRIYTHFGVSASESSTGAADSPSGSVRGEGSRKHLEGTSSPSPDKP